MYIMPNYQQSKIYKIISNNSDKIYIGSTTNQYLANRKAVHKKHYQMWKDDNTKQYCSSFELYDLGDVEYRQALGVSPMLDDFFQIEMAWIRRCGCSLPLQQGNGRRGLLGARCVLQ